MIRKRPRECYSDDEEETQIKINKNLFEACHSGNPSDVKKFLLDKSRLKIELNARDNHNWTPLHHAVNSDSLECVQLLLNEPEIDTKAESFEGLSALIIACSKPYYVKNYIAKALLEKDPELIHYVNNEKETVVHLALQHRNYDLAELLIDSDYPVDFTDLDNETALHIAVRFDSKEMIEYLLYANCDPDIRNLFGLTALELHVILTTCSIETLELFLRFAPIDLCGVAIKSIANQMYENYTIFNYLIQEYYTQPSNTKSYFVKILMKSWPFEDERPDMESNSLLYLYAVMHDEAGSIEIFKEHGLSIRKFDWDDFYIILCKVFTEQGFDVFFELLSEIMSKGFNYKSALRTVRIKKTCFGIKVILFYYKFCPISKQFTRFGLTIPKFDKFIETLIKFDAFNADSILDCLYEYFNPKDLSSADTLLYLLSKFRTQKLYLKDEYLMKKTIFYNYSMNFCSKFENVKKVTPEIIRMYEMYGSRNYPKFLQRIDSRVVLLPSLTSLCRFVILENLDKEVIKSKNYTDLQLPESLIKFLKFDYS